MAWVCVMLYKSSRNPVVIDSHDSCCCLGELEILVAYETLQVIKALFGDSLAKSVVKR